MDIKQVILNAATVENAKEYEVADEKFTFCIDLLGISAHHELSEDWVNDLEDKFDEINRAESSLPRELIFRHSPRTEG